MDSIKDILNSKIESELHSKLSPELSAKLGFELHKKDNLIYFDYRIKTLAKYAPDIETNLIIYPKKSSTNKFWNSILLIDANE
jgi:hypothetical protein